MPTCGLHLYLYEKVYPHTCLQLMLARDTNHKQQRGEIKLGVVEVSITLLQVRLQVQGPRNKFETGLGNLLSPCTSQRAGKRPGDKAPG